MKKFVCTVCGYVYEGTESPDVCTVCKAPAEKFKEQTGDREWAAEHVLLTEKVIRKSDCTGKKLLMKKLNMLQNSLNCLVK